MADDDSIESERDETRVRSAFRRGLAAGFVVTGLTAGIGFGIYHSWAADAVQAERKQDTAGSAEPRQPEPKEPAKTIDMPEDNAPAPAQVAAAGKGAAVRLPRRALELSSEKILFEADSIVKQLRAATGDATESLHVAALLAAQTRRSAEAMELWSQCMAKQPDVEMYLVNYAAVALDRGEGDKAKSILEQAASRGLKSGAVMQHLGLAYTLDGELEKAIAILKVCVEQSPQDAGALSALSKAQLENGEPEAARDTAKRALALGAHGAGTYFVIGTAESRLGNKEQAASFLKRYSEMTADRDVDTQTRFQNQDKRESLNTLMTVIGETAALYTSAGNVLDAERLWMRALLLEPNSAAACRALADLYYKRKMTAEERVVRERLVEVEPDVFGHYVDLAKCCAQLGDMPSAEAVLKEAMVRHPESIDAYAVLAEMTFSTGKLPDARWYAEQALTRGASPEGYELLERICRGQRDSTAADAARKRAQDMRAKSRP